MAGDHLFFEGHVYGEEADRVIREVVAPLARACRPDTVCWFFLRYAEERSHVHLRFFAPATVLEETIWPRIAEAASTSELVVRSTRERYEHEVERYGGPCGLALAEELFHLQSETALALLAKIPPGTRPQRLVKHCWPCCLLFLYRRERQAAADLVRSYGTDYLKIWAGNAEEQEHWLRTFQEVRPPGRPPRRLRGVSLGGSRIRRRADARARLLSPGHGRRSPPAAGAFRPGTPAPP